MRSFAFFVVAFLSIVDLAELQAAEARFRPALIGNRPNALINVIDTKKLMEKGQRDGLLMFTCYVRRDGKVWGYYTYRETPGSKWLKKEVEYRLTGCHFIPAIYNGEKTEVMVLGTVVFLVRDGQPHLRIYMNQNHDDVAKGNDFIAPQLKVDTPDWTGSKYNLAAYGAALNGKNGWIEMSVTTDTNGNQKNFKVILEDPPGLGFGTVVKDAFTKAKWVPGYRDGHPVECTFDVPLWYFTWTWWLERH
jgi:hypothetical protein